MFVLSCQGPEPHSVCQDVSPAVKSCFARSTFVKKAQYEVSVPVKVSHLCSLTGVKVSSWSGLLGYTSSFVLTFELQQSPALNPSLLYSVIQCSLDHTHFELNVEWSAKHKTCTFALSLFCNDMLQGIYIANHFMSSPKYLISHGGSPYTISRNT